MRIGQLVAFLPAGWEPGFDAEVVGRLESVVNGVAFVRTAAHQVWAVRPEQLQAI